MSSTNFAIIGAGNIARLHVRAIAQIPDARIVAVCSRTEETGRRLARSCHAAWTPSYREAVTQPEVDVVAVCTPSGTHADIAIAAARAGKHLLVEKPLDITLPRVDAIIETARAHNVKLACVFPYRFMHGVQRVKQALDVGRLGRVASADAYVKWYRPQAYYEGSWHGTLALDGGGALMNQAIHSIDLLQWLAGPVDNVFARTATVSHRIEVEDTAAAVLVYRHGALGVIQGATSCWPGDRARVEIRGDRGTLAVEEGRIVTWKLDDGDPLEEERMLTLETAPHSGAQDPTAIGAEMHRRQIADLVAAIRDDRPPTIDGAEARKAVEIIRALYHSAMTGQAVGLPFMDTDQSEP